VIVIILREIREVIVIILREIREVRRRSREKRGG